MNVVVVAKTRMGQNICVGAVGEEDGDLLRLIPKENPEFHSWRTFEPIIGALIEIKGAKSQKVIPPHIEDYFVAGWRDSRKHAKSLARWIENRCRIWTGNRLTLFDGALRFTRAGKGHIDRGDPLPLNSVGFWRLPGPMVSTGDQKHYRLEGGQPVLVPFVGIDTPPQEIKAGTLVRVSLSRWWAPEGSDMPEACWLQLSGLYPS